jgi:beta-glucosidase
MEGTIPSFHCNASSIFLASGVAMWPTMNPRTMNPTPERVESLLAAMTIDEKASLTSGADMWSTNAIERLGLNRVSVTDGPSGARGATFPDQNGPLSSFCAPCGTTLASSWDVDLAGRIGVVLGDEARTKQCRVLLAPTVNLHRSPLGGRSFECYSEDPFLSGKIAASYIRGVQSRGVATTVKHFAGNDAEFERFIINSVIDERTLREVTLLPFELAVTEGGSLGIMTAYNRLNGEYCTSSEWLLADVLRGEWGFEGFVVTDWFGRGTTAGAATAGLDLEMPGNSRIFGSKLAEAVHAGEVDESLLEGSARRLLTVFHRIGALDDEPNVAAISVDTPEQRALAREAAAAGTVLLENRGNLLPLAIDSITSLAVIGPNAESARIMGGGSAEVKPHYRITPVEALRARLGTDRVVVEKGCDIDRTLPAIPLELLAAGNGFSVEVFNGAEWAGAPTPGPHASTGAVLLFGGAGSSLPGAPYSWRATAALTVSETGEYLLSFVQLSPVRLLLDGEAIFDGITNPIRKGREFFGSGSEQLTHNITMQAGQTYELMLEGIVAEANFLNGAKIGLKPKPPTDLVERAVEAARNADVAVVIVGTNSDWESEGFDRESLDLPGEQEALIRAVAAVNPRTIVVLNTGAPVSTDWADVVPAVLQSGFGGQEMANALVDVLFGDTEPGGRLPTTYPARIEHTPAFGNFPGEFGQTRYGEGVFTGYRWYESRHLPYRYAFGHGLGYTTFEFGTPIASGTTTGPDGTITVRVPVTNTGTRRGSEVVQVYVAPDASCSVVRPAKELKAFAKLTLDPGERATAVFTLGSRAFAYWTPATDMPGADTVVPGAMGDRSVPSTPGWTVEPGTYTVHIGRASDNIIHCVPATIN